MSTSASKASTSRRRPLPGVSPDPDLGDQFLGAPLGQAGALRQRSGPRLREQRMDPLRVVQRGPRATAPQDVRADHHGHRPAVPGDGDLLALGHPVEDLRQSRPRLADRHRRHGVIVQQCTPTYNSRVQPWIRRRRASSAYRAVPSARAPSSNTACAEWLVGAVSGSLPGGQAPSMTNAPGTCSRTNEKSSAPVSGNSARSPRSAPNTSATVSPANAASAASLTVTGYSAA